MALNSSRLLSDLDNKIELLLSKFQEICQLAQVDDREYETQSVESLQIESNAWTITRIAEELLGVTRLLKEEWILGQTKVVDPENDANHLSDKQLVDLYSKVNTLLDDVTSVKK